MPTDSRPPRHEPGKPAPDDGRQTQILKRPSLRDRSRFSIPKNQSGELDSLLRLLVRERPPMNEEVWQALSTALQRLAQATSSHVALALDFTGNAKNDEAELRIIHGVNIAMDYDPKRPSTRHLVRADDPLMTPLRRMRSTLMPLCTRDDRPEPHPLLGTPLQTLLAEPVIVHQTPLGVVALANKGNERGLALDYDSQDREALFELAGAVEELFTRALDPQRRLSDEHRAMLFTRLTRCQRLNHDILSKVDRDFVRQFDRGLLEKLQILPLSAESNGMLTAAMIDPLDLNLQREFEALTEKTILYRLVATPAELAQALEKFFATSAPDNIRETVIDQYAALAEVERAARGEVIDADNSPLLLLANQIITAAISEGASDIHIEPGREDLVLRFRTDGVLRVVDRFPKRVLPALVNRIKIMSDMNIAEHRLPQDGRLIFSRFNKSLDVDLRVSIAPLVHGESIVLRVLDRERSTLPLSQLGFDPDLLAQYEHIIEAPYGMILHCGPTGSGKSASLYAAINAIMSPEDKILTAEDPVEYSLEGIHQLQVRPDIGLTFAAALRCFLRQDPDIILLGEIRDSETAKISVEAALTGHKLFSTLHTNDAPSAVARLADLGIKPFLISTSLLAICAQRLIRLLCQCKSLAPLSPNQMNLLASFGRDARTGFEAKGCERCQNKGYKGRSGVFELLPNSPELQSQMIITQNAHSLRQVAIELGMRPLFENGLIKFDQGLTSLNELLRVVAP